MFTVEVSYIPIGRSYWAEAGLNTDATAVY